MRRRPPRSTLFPYTTLVRSLDRLDRRLIVSVRIDGHPDFARVDIDDAVPCHSASDVGADSRDPRQRLQTPGHLRSEEHTSELQSRQYLVCRLLLEKTHPQMP